QQRVPGAHFRSASSFLASAVSSSCLSCFLRLLFLIVIQYRLLKAFEHFLQYPPEIVQCLTDRRDSINGPSVYIAGLIVESLANGKPLPFRSLLTEYAVIPCH